jgi:hypothetical protein
MSSSAVVVCSGRSTTNAFTSSPLIGCGTPMAGALSTRAPEIRAMKFSMPRPVVAGSFEDRDLHAGQQHVPLALLRIPR